MTLLERIKMLRDMHGGISVNKLEKEAGLTRGSMSKWDDHVPSYDKLKKVADYFGISVSDLTSDEQKKEAHQNGELDYDDKTLLDAYKKADDVTRELIRRALGLK